jgi:hypothetical protein
MASSSYPTTTGSTHATLAPVIGRTSRRFTTSVRSLASTRSTCEVGGGTGCSTSSAATMGCAGLLVLYPLFPRGRREILGGRQRRAGCSGGAEIA